MTRRSPVPLVLALALCAGQPDAAGTQQAWAACRQPSCEEGPCPRGPVVFSSMQCLQVAGVGIWNLLGVASLQMLTSDDSKPCAQAP